MGLKALKAKHALWLTKFEQWAAQNQWASFHREHYDWWMYPVDRRSDGQGELYHVPPAAFEALPAKMPRSSRGSSVGSN